MSRSAVSPETGGRPERQYACAALLAPISPQQLPEPRDVSSLPLGGGQPLALVQEDMFFVSGGPDKISPLLRTVATLSVTQSVRPLDASPTGDHRDGAPLTSATARLPPRRGNARGLLDAVVEEAALHEIRTRGGTTAPRPGRAQDQSPKSEPRWQRRPLQGAKERCADCSLSGCPKATVLSSLCDVCDDISEERIADIGARFYYRARVVKTRMKMERPALRFPSDVTLRM